MSVTDLLRPQCVALGRGPRDMQAAIHEMVGLMSCAGNLTDADAFERDVLAREAACPTVVGGGIAIPHAKSAAVTAPALAALTVAEPGLDVRHGGGAVRLMFLIASPEDGADLHVQVLAELAAMLMDPVLCAHLQNAQEPQEFLAFIAGWEAARRTPAAPAAPALPRVLAVTSCPLGLAHTYMAAEALQRAAAERHVTIKIETNGASGVENPLSAAEIEAAECIIVAADKSVETARFAGKPLLKVPVSDAVRTPGRVLEQALTGPLPLYQPGKDFDLGAWLRALPHVLYGHAMNGVSHMLPYVTGGGLIVALELLLARLGAPEALTSAMYEVGNTAFTLMYAALAAYIAKSMAGVPAMMPGALGGFLAELGITVSGKESWTSSGFLGALLAGLIAGLAVRGLERLCARMPKSVEHLKTMLIYPGAGLLIVSAAVCLVINPPVGQMNTWLVAALADLSGGSRLALGALLGALMATDYGGPFNKAAYVTGTMAVVGGQYDVMASVMLGGMTPPLGVALACLLCGSRFTQEERRTVPQNLILGCSFVTEGALPFALRDPLRVIPACMIGSAAAGGLSMLFGCGCPAPHGGLFLLPVIIRPFGFLLALAVGSLVTALLLAAWKKPLPPQ